MQEAVNARLIIPEPSLFRRRYLVDEQIGQCPGLERQRIGVIHRALAHHDLGAHLEVADGLGIGRKKRRAAEGAPPRPLRRPVRFVTPHRAKILHPETVPRPLGITRRHRYGGLALCTVFVQSEPTPALLHRVPGSAIGQVLLDLPTAGERAPCHYQFESIGARWFHREDARSSRWHHRRMLHLCRREGNPRHDPESNAKFHGATPAVPRTASSPATIPCPTCPPTRPMPFARSSPHATPGCCPRRCDSPSSCGRRRRPQPGSANRLPNESWCRLGR